MALIADLVDPRSVEPNLSAHRAREAIAEMVELLARSLAIGDHDALLRALLEREQLGSITVGGGVAIPHALVAGVDRPAIAIGRRVGGIPFGSIDGKRVTLLFLVVGPTGRFDEHLRLLSRLARLLRDAELLRRLGDAADAASMRGAIRAREAAEEGLP